MGMCAPLQNDTSCGVCFMRLLGVKMLCHLFMMSHPIPEEEVFEA